MGAMTNAYKILVSKPERKRPFGRIKHTRENTSYINIKEIVYQDLDLFYLAQDRPEWRPVLNAEMNLRVS
jgi:hypothetical protein